MTPQNWVTIAANSLRDTTAFPPLAPGEVHIWRASQAVEPDVLSRLDATLNSAEKARAARFVYARDRDRFIAASGILRELLAAYIGCAPAQIEFDRGPRGKPSLRAAGSPSRVDPAHASRFNREEVTLDPAGASRFHRAEESPPDRAEQSRSNRAEMSRFDRAEKASRIRFNVSHSQGLAAFAFALDRELGVDVEQIRENFGGEQIARHYFSPDEVAELMSLPPETRAEAFFLCWTRKEAYIKARGEGLYISLASFSVSLTPGAPERLRADDASRWELRSFQPKEGYAGAVMVEAAASSSSSPASLTGSSAGSPISSSAAESSLSLRFFDLRP